MAFLRQFSLKLSAGSEVNLAVVGNYIRIKSSIYDIRIRDISQNLGGYFDLSEGDDVLFDGNFKNVGFLNLGSGDIVVQVVIGEGVKSSSSKIGGTVKVVNGEIERVKAGQCFSSCASAPGLSSQYAGMQLWNPAASGKRLVLTKLTFQAVNVITGFSLIKSVAALTQNSFSTVVQNKDFSSAVANVGQIKVDAIAAAPNAGIFANYEYEKGTVEVPFLEPFIIGEGTGMLVHSNGVNVYAASTFQWYEENV